MKNIKDAARIVYDKFHDSNLFNKYFEDDNIKYVDFDDIFYLYLYEEMGESYSYENSKIIDDNFEFLSDVIYELKNEKDVKNNYCEAVINLSKDENKIKSVIDNNQFGYFQSVVDDYYTDDLKTTEEIRKSKNHVLKNIDISIIKKIVDLDNYNTIELISDNQFAMLNNNEIAKLYLNCDINECKYDKEKINILKNNGLFLNIVDIVKNNNLYIANDIQKIVYKDMEKMDNELFNKISEHNDYKNIEYCDDVKNNNYYIKTLIEKGYLNIIWSLKEEQFIEPLLSIISENIVNALYLYGKKELLESDIVYKLAFSKCNKPEDFKQLLNSIPDEYLTEKRRFECLINIGNEIGDKESFISYEDIKKELDKGNRLPEKAFEFLTNEEIIKLINDNHPEIVEMLNINRINKDILLTTFSKGYIPNENISELAKKIVSVEELVQLIKNGNYTVLFACVKLFERGLSLYLSSLPADIFDTLLKSDYKEKLFEISLVNELLFERIFNIEKVNEAGNDYVQDDKYIKQFIINDTIKSYIAFRRNNLYIINNFIKSIDDINKYFNDNGPSKQLFDVSFSNIELFNVLFKDDKWKMHYSDKEIESIESFFYYINDCGFVFSKKINCIDEIVKSFNKDGITSYGIQKVFESGFSSQVGKYLFEMLDRDIFKDYYYENYNISVLNNLLKYLDNNYAYLINFINETMKLPIPLTENDSKIIEEKLCIDILGENKTIDVIKYMFYADVDNSKIIDIIKNNNLKNVLHVYSMLFPNYDIRNLIIVANNYLNNKDLMDDLKHYSNLSTEEKISLHIIIVNGDINANKIIKKKDDLSNYNKIMYDNNEATINSRNIDSLKNLLFNSMFNISKENVEFLINKNEGNCLSKLKDSLVNENTKELFAEYEYVFNLLYNIYYSNDIEALTNMAINVNHLYENNNIDLLIGSWYCFSKLNNVLMTFVGEELNEKITDFNELLNCPTENIPKMPDGEDSFKVSDVSVKNVFTYDNVTISKDIKVKMVELNGLPFVACGHVLNAYGSGGKLSDFFHPRVIGKTNLCLSAIDDNHCSLVKREVEDINHVQLLFTKLPSDSLVISSEKDVSSFTGNNKLNISSLSSGKYNPVRETICNTSEQYNEYTFYRDRIVPSAILIQGDNPSECEIQAAAYLSSVLGKDIPLVKINKEKYPPLSVEQKKEKDAMLQETFYKYIHRDNNLKELNDKKELVHNLTDYLREICSGLGEYSNEESLVR